MESVVSMLLVQSRLQRAGVRALHHLYPDRFQCPAGDGMEHRTGQALTHLTHWHSPFPRTELSNHSASNRQKDAIQTQQDAGSLAGVQLAEHGCTARKARHFQKQNCVLKVVKSNTDAHLNGPIESYQSTCLHSNRLK